MTALDATPTTEHTETWRAAGAAWEHAALDWAFLFEPYARDAIETVFDRTDLGPGTQYLDVACGSGLALARAERLGAEGFGIDAAEGLVEIARRRAPTSDVVAGDMFALPWADDRFDVVSSFNGIWGGCEAAVAEIARVLRPDGSVGVTFWGPGDQLDLRDYFIMLGSTRQDVAEELIDLASIGQPGAVESMFAACGLHVVERAEVDAVLEFADEDMAWRALRSPGVVVPPLESVGEAELRQRTLASIEPFRATDGSYRIVNALTYVIARA